MKKSGRKKLKPFRTVLVIKRDAGEFVLTALGCLPEPNQKGSTYTVGLVAHVKTKTGKLRKIVEAEPAFLEAHRREIAATVSQAFHVANTYGKVKKWE